MIRNNFYSMYSVLVTFWKTVQDTQLTGVHSWDWDGHCERKQYNRRSSEKHLTTLLQPAQMPANSWSWQLVDILPVQLRFQSRQGAARGTVLPTGFILSSLTPSYKSSFVSTLFDSSSRRKVSVPVSIVGGCGGVYCCTNRGEQHNQVNSIRD